MNIIKIKETFSALDPSVLKRNVKISKKIRINTTERRIFMLKSLEKITITTIEINKM